MKQAHPRPSGLIRKSALCLAIAAGISSYAQAQETTSAILGRISAPDGTPAADTKIIIEHQPSGTLSEVKTNESGTYSVKGLRVGGPYKIIIDSDEFQDAEMRDLYLELGKTLRLDQTLGQLDITEEVLVVGTPDKSSSKGASSVFSERDIKNTPVFNRDIKDVVRNNPLAVVDDQGQLSIAGNNPRYNSITVDGIAQNDDFGLNYGGYPTKRPPVSLDAINQISVDTSPFTAKVGGFSGGLVNVVTKSGTNKFQGSMFYETMNDSFSGTPEGNSNLSLGDNTTFGLSAGGALVEDEAFYFVSYESRESNLSPGYGINGAGGNPSNVSAADYDRFLQVLSSTYGLSDSQADGLSDNDKKLLVKLDWNLNDMHRMDFSYQSQVNENESNTSDLAYQLRMASNAYTQKMESNTYVTHLFSEWSDAFSTEMGLSYKDVSANSQKRSPLGQVTVSVGTNEIVFGTDRYRYANIADTSTLQFHLDANYLLGDHGLKFGYQGSRVKLYNLFGDSVNGVWTFKSIDDFAAKKAATLSYKNAYTNNIDDLAYSTERLTHALYLEDNWALKNDLTLTFGVRYEQLASDSVPKENAAFVKTYGFSNTENLDGLGIVLPRVSFNWDLNNDMTLRGGIGRFSGGKPNVWIANSFTNDGITAVSAASSAITAAIADPANVDFSKIPDSVKASMKSGTGSVAYVDPDYKLESDWRLQLGWDQNLSIPYLGDDYLWSTEFNYAKKENSSFWVDSSRVEKRRTTDGGRIIYQSIYAANPNLVNNYDLMLTNADSDGRSIIWTTNLKKEWDNGINLFTAYTHQDITDANPGTSSTATSNYQYNVSVNRNEELVGTSLFEVKHRFILNLGYTAEFFKNNETRFNLSFERRAGTPVSWTLGAFNDNDLGDQRDLYNSDVYLPYIPTGPTDPNIDWVASDWPGATTAEEKYAQMQTLIQAAGLGKYAGGYAPKYSTTQPWVTELNLSIQQDIPGFAEGQKGTVYLTINNLLNLIDKNHGQVRRMDNPQQMLWDYDINAATGQYQYDQRFGGSDTRNWNKYIPEASVWRLKLGVRYSF